MKSSRVARVFTRKALKVQLFRVTSVLLGLAAVFTLAEIALRVVGWPAPGFYVKGHGPVKLRNPGRDGGAFPPSEIGELRHYDYDVEWTVNKYGFRDSEITPRRPGEWRIGILGDSFTAGVGVKQAERFTDIFGETLRRRRPNVSVWNLGAPLCGTACEAEMFNRVDPEYRLDEIVLAFYGGNDVEENSDWYLSDAKLSSVRPEEGLTFKIKGWLREHSRVATFLWVNAIRASATFRPPGIFNEADLNRYWPDTERSLRRLQDLAGLRRLTILYLPASPEWSDVVWQDMRQRYKTPDEGRHLVRNALEGWSRQQGIRFVDGTDWLRTCTSPMDCVFPVDAHWNAHAQMLVAQGLLTQTTW